MSSPYPTLFDTTAKPAPVSPSFDPNVIEERGELATSGELYARESLGRVHTLLGHFEQFAADNQNAPDTTRDAKRLAEYQARKDVATKADAILGAEMRRASGYVGSAERELATAMQSPTTQYDKEIRERLASKPQGERLSYLLKAAAAGDRMVVNAVLNAPAMLSGIEELGADAITALRERAALAAAPDAHAKFERARTVHRRLEQAYSTLVHSFAKHDARLEEIAAKAQKRSAAAASFRA